MKKKRGNGKEMPPPKNADMEHEGDEDEDEDESEKSLTADDLDKSLDQLEALASTESSRREDLLSKAQRGMLGDDERQELIQILESGGGELAASLQKSYTDNQALQDAIDVSDYLAANHQELIKSQTMLADAIEQGNTAQTEFNLILAKAVADVGRLVKSMSERLGVFEAQPARAPKSRGIPVNDMQKSFGGQPAPGESMSKSMVLDTLEAMHEDSLSKGMGGNVGGEDLMHAIAKYESTNFISPALMDRVRHFRAQAH